MKVERYSSGWWIFARMGLLPAVFCSKVHVVWFGLVWVGLAWANREGGGGRARVPRGFLQANARARDVCGAGRVGRTGPGLVFLLPVPLATKL